MEQKRIHKYDVHIIDSFQNCDWLLKIDKHYVRVNEHIIECHCKDFSEKKRCEHVIYLMNIGEYQKLSNKIDVEICTDFLLISLWCDELYV